MNLPSSTKDILMAEDDMDDVAIFEMAMDSLGLNYELRNARNGDVLFVLLQEKIPYILFLDIRMPCKDGLSCIMEIRQNKDYDGLPVIMYTSTTNPKTIEETYRNGANLFFQKTNTFNELVKNLKTIFSYDWSNQLSFPPIDRFVLS